MSRKKQKQAWRRLPNTRIFDGTMAMVSWLIGLIVSLVLLVIAILLVGGLLTWLGVPASIRRGVIVASCTLFGAAWGLGITWHLAVWFRKLFIARSFRVSVERDARWGEKMLVRVTQNFRKSTQLFNFKCELLEFHETHEEDGGSESTRIKCELFESPEPIEVSASSPFQREFLLKLPTRENFCVNREQTERALNALSPETTSQLRLEIQAEIAEGFVYANSFQLWSEDWIEYADGKKAREKNNLLPN